MKKILYFGIYFFLTIVLTFAQTPEQFKYQAVLRNADGTIMANENVTVDISILQGSVTGTSVFTESHNVTTTAQGLINLNIGSISDLNVIDWSTDTYFIEISINGTVMGTSQLLSVPYAFNAKYAETADYNNLANTPDIPSDISELSDNNNLIFDGQWSSLTGTAPNISIFNNDAGYLTSFSETDPTFTDNFDFTDASSGDLLQYNGTKFVKYTPNYLTSYTESDPVFSAWDKHTGISITESQISDFGSYLTSENDPTFTDNFDFTGVSSGDLLQYNGTKFVKFTPNYLTTEVDSSVTNEIQDLTLSGNILKITNNSNATNIDLSLYLDNTDNQNLDNVLTQGTSAGNKNITDLADPVNQQDAVTKKYLLDIINALNRGVTDIDGNHYDVVIIGDQLWMTENLKVTHYPDGTPIPNITDSTAWANLDNNNNDDAYCFHNNDNTSGVGTYGALYTYAAVIADNWQHDNIDNQGVCPDGWHVPSEAEWLELFDYLEGDSIAGGKLKEAGTTHWISPNTGATNESGFTGLPGGYRDYNAIFLGEDQLGYWWAADDKNSHAPFIRLGAYTEEAYKGYSYKSNGYSVRCVKD